ncbi:MAG TPA: HEAT repeat domain-containing protein [Dokdonella sp.]|nr:HEAT repeat domain-containing protein [Dokdonella sp.]
MKRALSVLFGVIASGATASGAIPSDAIAAAASAADPHVRIAATSASRSIAEPLFDEGRATDPYFDAFYADMVERLPTQERVERALELAINRREGAAAYVIRNAQRWRGSFGPGERLDALVGLGGDSPLIEVRMAAFEVRLAEFGLEKSRAQVDRLVRQMADDPQRFSAWALWNLGLLGARGVERERILPELLSAAHAGDESLRRWAVEALAMFGGVESIPPLLDVAAHEPSPRVRERAFCALAQSGTLHLAERYEAVPGLFAIASDARGDRRSVSWAFQALREITGIRGLDDDAASWQSRLEQANLL